MADKRKIPKQPKKTAKPKSRGQRRLRVALWLFVLTVFFAGAAFGVNLLYEHRLVDLAKAKETSEVSAPPADGEGGTFKIRSLTVEGNKHYSSDQILRASGLYVGQSSWDVNKAQAVANIKAACPYVESASISSTLLNTITITVKETTIVGAMYHDGAWWLVGKNGQAVDKMPIDSDAPARYLYFKGATATGKGLGKQAMDDRCTEIVNTYLAAAEEYELTGICELDLSNKSDLKLNWNNQITILLGNDSNLEYQIEVLKATLPKVLKNKGQQAHGTLDLSSYSNENATNRVVFTPDN